MAATLEDDTDPTFTHFAHRQEYFGLLERFLKVDWRREPGEKENEDEDRLVLHLGLILDYYLPLPGLLDPHLSQIVPPLMESLAQALVELTDNVPRQISQRRLRRLGKVVNWVSKVRGWKAVVAYFPSSITYLSQLVTLLSPPTSPSTSSAPITPHHHILCGQDAWELRTVLLLWLALLLTVPFDLAALSSPTDVVPSVDFHARQLLFEIKVSQMAQRVTLLAIPCLHKPGKEGAYASLVLAKLYSRNDVVQSLSSFFNWCRAELEEGDRDTEANLVASLFEFLAVLPSLLAPEHLPLLETFTVDVLLPHLRGSRTAAGSGLIRKLAVKARGRWWMARLSKGQSQAIREDIEDLPDGMEEQLDDLMNGLSDKDTIVRYSCAKYLARLASLLPTAFTEQIVLATIGLFAGTEDEPVVEGDFDVVLDPGGTASSEGTMGFGGSETTRGESRWHGCCLAVAEMARRGLVKDNQAIRDSINWVLKALLFDLRRSSHSIGANVRDAAAYLLWSLSRACPPSALEYAAERIATTLATVACFDREVGVRRAASAAFQEGVGRLGLYPEGIDILMKTDFYSVSVRRLAFTSAASGVAVHEVYRRRMKDHLHYITLRHWDSAMRVIGSVALRDILQLGTPEDLQNSMDREISQLISLDAVNVHGALVALVQIAQMLEGEDVRRETILHAISSIRPAALVSPQGADIVQAACDLVVASLSPAVIKLTVLDELVGHYLDLAMKRKEADCHEAAARMIKKISSFRPARKEVVQLLEMLRGARSIPRQIGALALGHVQYVRCPELIDRVVKALLRQGEESAKADVETRRYAIRSLISIVRQTSKDGDLLVDDGQFADSFEAFLSALGDYSTDQRGDVGSWVRCAGITALGQAIAIAAQRQKPMGMLSQETFKAAVGGIVKLGLEKLEPVRAASWRAWRTMHAAKAGEKWTWQGSDIWSFNVKDDSDESFRYIPLKEWFSSAMPLLGTLYKRDLVSGLLHSIGSQVESLAVVAMLALKEYLLSTESTSEITLGVLSILQGTLASNINQNRVFIPSLATVIKILSDGKLKVAVERATSLECVVAAVGTCCRGIPQIKSIERITGVLKLVIAAFELENTAVKTRAINALPLFLAHRFPRVRAIASESLYLALSSIDDDVDPDLEQVLLETAWTEDGVGADQAATVVNLLKRELK